MLDGGVGTPNVSRPHPEIERDPRVMNVVNSERIVFPWAILGPVECYLIQPSTHDLNPPTRLWLCQECSRELRIAAKDAPGPTKKFRKSSLGNSGKKARIQQGQHDPERQAVAVEEPGGKVEDCNIRRMAP